MSSNGWLFPEMEKPRTGRVVYARYIRRRDGRIVYPKRAKCFRFIVKD